MIVTIDGPAGAGKSSVAKRLAERLGFGFLDTGLMYRAVAWGLAQRQVDLSAHDQVAAEVHRLEVRLQDHVAWVGGRDVTRYLRSTEVSQHASIVAAIPAVREKLVEMQRSIASQGNYVCEGRDQGTVAFPDAECKIFLTAAPEVRAKRRWDELKDKQPDLSLDHVVAEQKIRDLRDETRPVGRLVKADDAVEIRVDSLTLNQVIDQIESLVRKATRLA